MFPLVLLLTQVCSASEPSLTPSPISYEKQDCSSGTLGYYGISLFFFDVVNPSVHTLIFNLTAESGNPNIFVSAYGGGGWSSLTEGSEYVVILNSDVQFEEDGLGLVRRFQVRIMAITREETNYKLTITQIATSDWEPDTGDIFEDSACEEDELVTMKKYKGDVGKHMKAVETSNSWMGVVGGMVLLGAGVCAWRKWGGRQGKNEELAYRLI